ncbi:MAG: sulfite exporter TauE/SafE family protein [Staphylothermus sp.]|nr:sulfite exporter TauE/SafE family protein [Staphylothermus sp.]
MLDVIIYLIIGLMATMLGSMSGLGGGFLAIPSLIYLGVPLQYVVGTSKFMVFINSIVSTYRYSRRIRFPLKLYICVVVPMILTAYLGAYLVVLLPTKILKIAIGVVLLIGSIRMIIQRQKQQNNSLNNIEGQALPMRNYMSAVLSGTVAGLVAGLSGLGGGIVNVPMFIYVLGLNPHLAVSLSMACILPSALSSVIRHYIDDVIVWNIAIPLSVGAVLGGWIGPRIALSMKRETLRKIIGVIIALATIRIILETLLS